MSDYARLKQHYGEWMTIEDIQNELNVKHISRRTLYSMHYKLRARKDDPMRRERIYSIFDVAKLIDYRRAAREIRLCKNCMFQGRFGGSNGMVYCDYAEKVGVTKFHLKRHGMPNATDAEHCPLYIKGGQYGSEYNTD